MLSVPSVYRNYDVQWAITACFYLLDYLKKSLNIGEGVLPWMKQSFHHIYIYPEITSTSYKNQIRNKNDLNNNESKQFILSWDEKRFKKDIKVKDIINQLYQNFKNDENNINTQEKLEEFLKRIHQCIFLSLNNNYMNDKSSIYTNQNHKIQIKKQVSLPIMTCQCQLDPITGYTKLRSKKQYFMASSDNNHFTNKKTNNTSVRCLSGEEIQLGLNTTPHYYSKSFIYPLDISKIKYNNYTKLSHYHYGTDFSLPLPPNSGTIDNNNKEIKNEVIHIQKCSSSNYSIQPTNYNELYQIYLNCKKNQIKDHLSDAQLVNSYNNFINTSIHPNNSIKKFNNEKGTIEYPNFYKKKQSHNLPAEILKRIFLFHSLNSDDDFTSLMLVCRQWYQLETICRWQTLNLNLSKPWKPFYFLLTSQQFPISSLNSLHPQNRDGNLFSILNNIYYSSYNSTGIEISKN
ncbi:hypothetical protein BCR36DRAFT_450318 [Piromyces finnis]|uniref:F-box domain-containing protein n=1 Tax=Piromyces finnis TaxID=1754191 RepID=A0A1Y1V9A8_9FUNG|nr:hypothetical protein BCR36DRAFT_450318 [Piromyces finnis]|eukprot:ORX49666.1 hypothetical protein BCR36DRAFT_450318 [Piromyces finnis]